MTTPAPDDEGPLTISRAGLRDMQRCAEYELHERYRSLLDRTVQDVTHRLNAAHLDDRRDLRLQLRRARRERDELRDELEAIKSRAKEKKPTLGLIES